MRGTIEHRWGRQGAMAIAVSALAMALCATSAQADKGGVPHAGSNGRGAQGAPPPPAQDKGGNQEAEGQQQPARPEQSARPKKAKHDRKAPKHHKAPKHESAPASSAPQQPQAPQHEAGSSHGQPKTTICHRTHSAKNPWVRITVANPSLKAHRAHGDIIPAPAGGCPKPQEESQPPPTTTQPPEESPPPDNTPPVSPGELPGDFQMTASASPTATPTTPTQTAASSVQPAPASPATGEGQATTPTGAVLDTSVSAPSSGAGGRVLAASVTRPSSASGTAPTAVEAASRSSGSGLPFTGSPVWLLALMGAGAVLAGFALRRAILSRR